MIFLEYPKCTTCQKARKWLDAHGVAYEDSGVELKKFFNTSGLIYKNLGLKDKLPTMTDEEKYALLATDGMLVKRPLVIGEDFVLIGFKEAQWEEKLL